MSSAVRPPSATVSRTWATVGRIIRYALRSPFALGLTAALWIAGASTGSLVSGPSRPLAAAVAVSAHSIGADRWWVLATSVLFAGSLFSYLLASVMLLGLLGWAERTMGTFRAAAAFGLGHLLAVVGYLVLTAAGMRVGEDWLGSLYGSPIIGPYAGSLAAGIAASAWLGVLWRRRLRLVCSATAVTLMLYVGHPQSLLAALGVAAGYLLGRAFHGPAAAGGSVLRSTARETRALLAILVAVFATGPLLAGLARQPDGPLADLRSVIVNPLPSSVDLSRNCNAAIDISCPQILHGSALTGPGSLVLSVVPLALLLLCADGMRRGNRMALWTTVTVQLLLSVLAAVHLQLFALFTARRGNGVHVPLATLEDVLPAVLVPLVLAAVLIARRRYFSLETRAVTTRRVVAVITATFAVFAGLYVAVWFGEGNAAHHRNVWLSVLGGLPRMFLPYPFPPRYAIAVEPHGAFSTALFGAGGAVFWLVCLVGLLILFRGTWRVSHDTASAAAHARALVHVGGGSLSWMALWPDNTYWFNADGTVGMAYQRHFGVAVTVAGPFGNPDGHEAAYEEFSRFCTGQGLVPCFYSITGDHWERLRGLGFRRFAVAQEALLPIREIQFTGKSWQNVRTAVNRARKLGVEARWYRYGSLPRALRAQIHEISEAWVAERALPEMGFTLGGLTELMDDEVLLCLAVDRNDHVHGVVSWLPVFRDGTTVSWTLDFMRRSFDGFNGVMEFLIAAAVQRFRDEVDVISLSGSPLAPAPDEVPAGDRAAAATSAEGAAVRPLLDRLARGLEPVYGFASLAAFKQRFRPVHRPLYLAYHDPLMLPLIGRAVTEAYTPNLSVRQTARLVRGMAGGSLTHS